MVSKLVPLSPLLNHTFDVDMIKHYYVKLVIVKWMIKCLAGLGPIKISLHQGYKMVKEYYLTAGRPDGGTSPKAACK